MCVKGWLSMVFRLIATSIWCGLSQRLNLSRPTKIYLQTAARVVYVKTIKKAPLSHCEIVSVVLSSTVVSTAENE